MRKLVEEYTRVVENSNVQNPMVTELEVMQGQFPWSLLSGKGVIKMVGVCIVIKCWIVQGVTVCLQRKGMKL